MGKSLKHRLRFWKQKAREPEDVSHHFSGSKCISECEIFVYNTPLLRAIVLEWLMRHPGVRTISEMINDLGVRTTGPLFVMLVTLQDECQVTLSARYSMLSAGWHPLQPASDRQAAITPGEWLRRVAFEQENERRA